MEIEEVSFGLVKNSTSLSCSRHSWCDDMSIFNGEKHFRNDGFLTVAVSHQSLNARKAWIPFKMKA